MSSLTDFIKRPNDFFISLGDYAFFGEGAYIKDVSITSRVVDPICISSWHDAYQEYIPGRPPSSEITITAIAPSMEVLFNKKARVSLKLVRDCSIDELIFAIREKIKSGEL